MTQSQVQPFFPIGDFSYISYCFKTYVHKCNASLCLFSSIQLWLQYSKHSTFYIDCWFELCDNCSNLTCAGASSVIGCIADVTVAHVTANSIGTAAVNTVTIIRFQSALVDIWNVTIKKLFYYIFDVCRRTEPIVWWRCQSDPLWPWTTYIFSIDMTRWC